jgi:transposase-like protein
MGIVQPQYTERAICDWRKEKRKLCKILRKFTTKSAPFVQYDQSQYKRNTNGLQSVFSMLLQKASC